jgi:hypothetical protein
MLNAYSAAGGATVAHVGAIGDALAAALSSTYERHVSVTLSDDTLTFWVLRKAQHSAAAQTFGVLDVRLELVDLEAPEWAAAPAPASGSGPFTPEIGGRTIPLKGVNTAG